MKSSEFITYCCLILVVFGCGPNLRDPQALIDLANEAHGTQVLESHQIAFDFRDRHYTASRADGQFVYTREFKDSTGQVRDVLINSADLTRYINDTPSTLTEEWAGKYANSVNSVLYFFQLPYPLNDPAVVKSDGGVYMIGNAKYHAVKVTFKQEQGGKDFEDEFMYWLNAKTFLIDFLAYNYITDGGGVRFRQAINRRTLNGLVVQDYVNYKPPSKTTPLEDLPLLFEQGNLEQLSRIENSNVQVTLRRNN